MLSQMQEWFLCSSGSSVVPGSVRGYRFHRSDGPLFFKHPGNVRIMFIGFEHRLLQGQIEAVRNETLLYSASNKLLGTIDEERGVLFSVYDPASGDLVILEHCKCRHSSLDVSPKRTVVAPAVYKVAIFLPLRKGDRIVNHPAIEKPEYSYFSNSRVSSHLDGRLLFSDLINLILHLFSMAI